MQSPKSPTVPSLETSMSTALAKRKKNQTIRSLTTFPPGSADFSSNDFLSLSTSPALRDLYFQELNNHDPSPSPTSLSSKLGSGGSRLLDGNSTYAEALEDTISSFHSPSSPSYGLLCNSGYDANTALFSCLPQSGDYIVYDEYIHASVHDGMRLSRAKETRFFAHNDVRALRAVLEQIIEEDVRAKEGRANVFIAVEAVYSMDGDVGDLAGIVKMKNELFFGEGRGGNAYLIVDEAHSNGWVGPTGRGLVSDLGLEGECLVRLHTFGKALACNGAILLCATSVLREYLINYARPLIYTTFMSYPNLAAIKASYEFLIAGKGEPLARNLRFLIRTLYERLREMEAELRLPIELAHLLRCPKELPETPIFAVLSSEPKVLAAYCQKNGFVVRGIVPPTVPLGTERIRVCLHAGNTVEQIDGLVSCIRKWTVERARETGNAGRTRL
ncbi:Putative aminotransferase, class I/classII, pyridoxal phosphate-dependent transferase, major [Septoria linicola]|uniref:Aminotransferase, class I/classII, pyridoxal phosphate-dependent transferase, major n=1 Tax=Septoria linicola TaxID=215465 RepID=A0A9Q9ER49_9PEZI|nr:Putative aminotransferase, class I/classII, pyridoxal phosphate-dependent transferase, major [Septoria linicola]